MTETTIKQRGETSLELKLRYLLPSDPKRRIEKYRVDLHFFLPTAFAVNHDTFPSARFYENTKLYVRFNTPGLETRNLLDPDSDESPLARIERFVAGESGEHEIDERMFIYESKMLGAIYKSLLRASFGGMGTITSLDDEVDESDDDDSEIDEVGPEDPKTRVKSLSQVAKRFHDITHAVVTRDDLSTLHQHCTMIDEHLSLLTEKYLTSYVNHYQLAESDPPLYKLFSKVIISEANYRADRGYPTALPDPDNDVRLEEYVYRQKMLKKYISEVLFFRVKTTNEARRTEHLLYAVAAGIAMMFATAIAFFGQTWFGGVSLSLFLLLVVSYMLKDRIKDFFRDLFRRSLGRRFYDRREHLYDAIFRSKLATVRERVSFLRPKDEDPAVIRIRNRGPFETQLSKSGAESHMLYRKMVTVRAATMRRIHRRVRGLADITIVSLSRLLRNLASQSASIPVVVGKKAVEVRSVERVYHLNLIVSHRSAFGETLERFRLVVTRRGIRRIEPVSRVQV